METNLTPGTLSILPFKRKKWCIFCFIFSIPHRPGLYAGTTRGNGVSLTSSNPNEIFGEVKRSMPSPLVKSVDTDGLQIDEAIAWKRVDKMSLSAEFDILKQANYEQIVVPQSVGELLGLTEKEPAENKIIVGKKSGISPNSFFGALLLRLYTQIRFFVGYGIPLIIPFSVIKPELILPVLALFGVNLVLSALVWPYIRIRSWIKGILLALITTSAYGLGSYFALPQFFNPGLVAATFITGVLVGLLLDCTDPEK